MNSEEAQRQLRLPHLRRPLQDEELEPAVLRPEPRCVVSLPKIDWRKAPELLKLLREGFPDLELLLLVLELFCLCDQPLKL